MSGSMNDITSSMKDPFTVPINNPPPSFAPFTALVTMITGTGLGVEFDRFDVEFDKFEVDVDVDFVDLAK